MGGNVQTTKLIHWVPPGYPSDAEKAGLKGVVLVRVTVTEAGDVSDAQVVRGHPMLVQAALTAVRQWKYSPTLLNGQAVKVVATQALSFPPGKEPEKLTSGSPSFDLEGIVWLGVDETGALFREGQQLDPANLSQALQGKQALVFAMRPTPEPEVIEQAMDRLEKAGPFGPATENENSRARLFSKQLIFS
ncbi:MAG: energy transducer TonB [Acidobacteriota bacterium]